MHHRYRRYGAAGLAGKAYTESRARRKRGDALAGNWEFPGGKLEAGETPEACLRRELAEEFGVDTKIGAFICSCGFEYKHLPIELPAYKAEHVSSEFKLNDHDRIE